MPLLPRTLLLLDEPFSRIGDTYYSPFTWWRFAQLLASHCESFTLYVPFRDLPGGDPGGDPVEPDGMEIVGRAYYQRIYQYYLRLPAQRRRLRRQLRDLMLRHELVICRIPAPVGGLVAREANILHRPLVLIVAGNIETQSALIAGQKGMKAWVGRRLARHLTQRDFGMARQSILVGAWSDELRELFLPHAPRVEVCQSPNIRNRDLVPREDSCTGAVIRIVRVCRILPSKGIEFLIEAVATLRDEGRPLVLDVIGGGDVQDYVQSLRRVASGLGVSEQVTLHGPVPFGPRLFEFYRHADAHVVSSLGEGTPRCIVEGRAFGLPTIGTRVGGIPSVIKDGEDGLLVEAGSAAALTNAIRRVIDDSDLRQRLIRNGFEVARRNTAEVHAERLAKLIADSLNRRLTGGNAGSHAPGSNR
jgi:glycosyltransferase involved in cell wall biosynthesis